MNGSELHPVGSCESLKTPERGLYQQASHTVNLAEASAKHEKLKVNSCSRRLQELSWHVGLQESMGG